MRIAVKDIFAGICNGRRDALAKAITLVESTRKDHKVDARQLLAMLSSLKKPTFARSLRLGVAGPPGAGKSTFIENLGMRLIAGSHRVAVIPVDPSSHISGGSILGDKTRMEKLCLQSNAYIRASPTRGVLGGIAEHTADVISLCEAANFNVVIVESVGLGQSEVEIDCAVDMLVVLIPPGGGDGLQASKKGIMEAADMVLVNKADGNLHDAAKHTKADYSGSMQFIRQKHPAWQPRVLMASSVTGLGMDEVEKAIWSFHSTMVEGGHMQAKRGRQAVAWMRGQVRRQLIEMVETDERVQKRCDELSKAVSAQGLHPAVAASQLLEEFILNLKRS